MWTPVLTVKSSLLDHVTRVEVGCKGHASSLACGSTTSVLSMSTFHPEEENSVIF